MSKNQQALSTPGSYISLIVIGIGIGSLIGLSISPVVSIVISSVTGTAAAIVAAMSGLEKSNGDKSSHSSPNRWQINPIPFALLIVGLLIGTMTGMIVRNTHLFGSDVSIEVSKWTRTGFSEEDITKRIFEVRYPKDGQASAQSASSADTPLGTVLFTASAEQCDMLVAKSIKLTGDIADLKEQLGDNNLLLDNIVAEAETLKVMIRDEICVEEVN